MSSQFQKFKALHQSRELFELPNAWNARSAIICQEKHFPAVGTSSAAVAASLGYEDGEQMNFDEYLFIIRRIIAAIQIPLTVDIEMGYGRTNKEIFSNIQRLIEIGVVGINLEDSITNDGVRSLQEASTFAQTIEYIKKELASKALDLFLNVRCDTYILDVNNKQQETKSRIKMYEAAGADGIFLPCISNEDDIAEATATTKLPLNVMYVPGLPDLDVLNTLGVKRVSMGPFLFNKVYDEIGSFLPLKITK